MKVLLDQIQHTTIGEQNDEPTDSVESESESDSNSQDSSTNDSEEGQVAPVQQRVTKKKVIAKVVGAGGTSEDDDDGMDLTSISCCRLQIIMYRAFRHHVGDCQPMQRKSKNG